MLTLYNFILAYHEQIADQENKVTLLETQLLQDVRMNNNT